MMMDVDCLIDLLRSSVTALKINADDSYGVWATVTSLATNFSCEFNFKLSN